MSDLRSNVTGDRSLMGRSAASVWKYFPSFRWALFVQGRLYLKVKVLQFFKTSGNSHPVTRR